MCSTVLDKDAEEERTEDWEERGGAKSPPFAPATQANFGATLASAYLDMRRGHVM